MDNERRKDIAERCLNFGVMVVQHAVTLPKTDVGRILVRQFVRSGTSVGANVEEAQDAASKKDFINKMSIALREAEETQYWMRLMSKIGVNSNIFVRVFRECQEICAILTVIVKNAKK